MVEETCINISWTNSSCAIGYIITTDFLGLTNITDDTNITICGISYAIYIQPINSNGDGGISASATGNQANFVINLLSLILMH